LIVDDRPVVAGASDDPLLPTSDAWVPWVDPGLTTSAESLGRVVDAVVAEVRGCDRIVVRLPPDVVHAPERAGFERLTRYVAKKPSPATPGPAEWTVLPFAEEDRPFVHRLLVRAIVDGYRSGGFVVSEEAAQAHVELDFASFSEAGPVSAYVAFEDGRRVGHATWLHGVADDVTGELFAEVFDVFVVPEHRGRGIDRALVQAVDAAVAPLGRRSLGHIVCEPDGRDARVLEKLQAGGWQEAYVLWHKRLAR